MDALILEECNNYKMKVLPHEQHFHFINPLITLLNNQEGKTPVHIA
jgi:hypothetical protein